MGLNLSGLCGADPACAWKPPASATPSPRPSAPASCPGSEHPIPCLAGEVVDPATGCCAIQQIGVTYNSLAASGNPQAVSILNQVANSLTTIAARVGSQYVCPHLPAIGKVLGVAAGDAIEVSELPIIGPLAIAIPVLTEIIGYEAGLEVQRNLCS